MSFKIFNIEPTNVCNAKCSFCPNGTGMMTREKGFMSIDTLINALSFCESNSIGIYGCGEPLLHPDINIIIGKITAHGLKSQLNTNGKFLTEEMYIELYRGGLTRLILSVDFFEPDVSFPEFNNLPIERFRIYGSPKENEIKKDAHSWGEQVGNENRDKIECNFYLDNWVQIMWDGTIVRCCMDFDAKEPFGNVNNYNGEDYTGRKISVCSKCKGFRFKSAIVNGDYDGQLPETVADDN